MAKQESVTLVTKNVTKKGKLKGKNKKETKFLKAICPHHKYNKHGNIKSIVSVMDDYCVCDLCGERFPASFYKDDEIHKIVGDFKELNNQNKFTAAATNAGADVQKYFGTVASNLIKYEKISKKNRDLAQKSSKVKKKKKNNYAGSNTYGSWGSSNKR